MACEAEWAFDVNFDVMCTEPPLHEGDHRAVIEGNGGVLATITWPQVPGTVPGEVVRSPARPALLPDPVIHQREA